MRVAARTPVQPAENDVRRNPITCVLMTAAIAGGFWLGLIWLAQRIY